MLADVHVHVHVCSILLFLLTAVKNRRKGRWCIKSRRRCTDFNFFLFSFFHFGLILLVLLILIIVGGVPSSFLYCATCQSQLVQNIQDIDWGWAMLACQWMYKVSWKEYEEDEVKEETNCRLTQFRFGLNCSFFFTCLILLIIAVVG